MRSDRRLPGVWPVFRQAFRASSRPPFPFAQRGAHAEPRRTLGASPSGKFRYLIYGEQSATGHLSRVMRALRAVGAIFRTSARLNREQAAELDAPRVMEFPMQLLGLEQEIGKWLPVNLTNLCASPGVTYVCVDACSVFRQVLPPESRELHAEPD